MNLSANCARCGGEVTIIVKPYDIYCRKGSFYATEWEQEDNCACQLLTPAEAALVDAAEISRLLDLHPDTEREWRDGKAERAEAFEEATRGD